MIDANVLQDAVDGLDAVDAWIVVVVVFVVDVHGQRQCVRLGRCVDEMRIEYSVEIRSGGDGEIVVRQRVIARAWFGRRGKSGIVHLLLRRRLIDLTKRTTTARRTASLERSFE